jgi:hypothetical protein
MMDKEEIRYEKKTVNAYRLHLLNSEKPAATGFPGFPTVTSGCRSMM